MLKLTPIDCSSCIHHHDCVISHVTNCQGYKTEPIPRMVFGSCRNCRRNSNVDTCRYKRSWEDKSFCRHFMGKDLKD